MPYTAIVRTNPTTLSGPQGVARFPHARSGTGYTLPVSPWYEAGIVVTDCREGVIGLKKLENQQSLHASTAG